MTERYLTKQSLAFLADLAENNNRAWFEAHQQDYETLVRSPALALIGDVAADLPMISPHFLAIPKKVGGSLMRIYRDTRFSKDKTPYKTNIGIQFRHEAGKDIHAPGYYVHVEPGECFVGIGLWRPDADALFKIRGAIVEHGDSWVKARDNKVFREHFSLAGDALANAPRGFDKHHPLVEDLKRKDFICMAPLSEATVTSKNLREYVVQRFSEATPYIAFLCKALQLRF